jgi:hypothetical protein
MLFSYGGLTNPPVMGSPPTHAAPVTLKTEISNVEVLTQICVVTQSGTFSTRDLSDSFAYSTLHGSFKDGH